MPREVGRPLRRAAKTHKREKKRKQQSVRNHPFYVTFSPYHLSCLHPSLSLPSSPSVFHSDHFVHCRDPHVSSHSPLIPIKTYMQTSQTGWGPSAPHVPRRERVLPLTGTENGGWKSQVTSLYGWPLIKMIWNYIKWKGGVGRAEEENRTYLRNVEKTQHIYVFKINLWVGHQFHSWIFLFCQLIYKINKCWNKNEFITIQLIIIF